MLTRLLSAIKLLTRPENKLPEMHGKIEGVLQSATNHTKKGGSGLREGQKEWAEGLGRKEIRT